MTLDGKIATKSGDSRISSRADLKRLHRTRSQADAVMVGIGTQLHDNPRLTVRFVKGKDPVRIIVDSRARTHPRSRIFSGAEGTIVVVSKSAPRYRTRRLERAGAQVITCGEKKVNLGLLLQRLRKMKIKRLLLEGGGRLNWSMLNARLVDEVHVTLAPRIVGGEDATTLVEGTGVSKVGSAIKLSLKDVRRDDGELVLNYSVHRQ